MTDTIQVVRVDGDVPHFHIDQPVGEGWVGTVAPIIVEGTPGDYVIVPAEDVIELTEEAEEFDDENDRYLRMFSSPIKSGPDDV